MHDGDGDTLALGMLDGDTLSPSLGCEVGQSDTEGFLQGSKLGMLDADGFSQGFELGMPEGLDPSLSCEVGQSQHARHTRVFTWLCRMTGFKLRMSDALGPSFGKVKGSSDG